MLELPPPLAVVCHDAGAANIILAWLRASKVFYRAVMQGPAAQRWAECFGTAALSASIEDALDGAASLLSGTGWGSSLDMKPGARLANAASAR